jgi:hypothetical protein
MEAMSESARMAWSAARWVSALVVLSGFRAAASVYNYEVTGTFPSNTITTTYWAPNEPFEYQFSLEPQPLNYIGPESHILLPAEISYFLKGQLIARFDDLVSFTTGLTVTGLFGTNLGFPFLEALPPVFFQGWFPGNPFQPESPRLYSYTLSFNSLTLTVVPTLYTGTFNVINENDGSYPGGFFGATVGAPGEWDISDAVVRVSLVPEASSLASAGLGIILAIGLWAFRRRCRRA